MTKYTGVLLKRKRLEENVILHWIKRTNIIWLVCRRIICRTLGFTCQNESDHISDGFILQAGTRMKAQPPFRELYLSKRLSSNLLICTELQACTLFIVLFHGAVNRHKSLVRNIVQPDTKASHLTESKRYLFDSVSLRLWIREESGLKTMN